MSKTNITKNKSHSIFKGWFFMNKRFRKKDNTQFNYINYKLAKKNIIQLNAMLGSKKEIFLRNF